MYSMQIISSLALWCFRGWCCKNEKQEDRNTIAMAGIGQQESEYETPDESPNGKRSHDAYPSHGDYQHPIRLEHDDINDTMAAQLQGPSRLSEHGYEIVP